MTENETNVMLLVLLCAGLLLVAVSWLRYRYYKIDQRHLLPPTAPACHIIDQPGGEYVKVLGKGDTVYDWEDD